jgi:predicted phage terminase large subunit-like protein
MDKRLTTIRDVVFPLNVNARVVIIGTVTMPGSIIHQLVRSQRVEDEEVPEWITEERVRVHFYPPFIKRDDGTEESVWPGRWTFEFLDSIRHTRSFAKNYANDPMGHDGAYWSTDDFEYGDVPGITRRVLTIDPAVTTKKSSDPTGLAVVSYSPVAGKALVEHSVSVRLTGRELRAYALKLIGRFDADGRPIGGILIEVNQGGDLWKNDVFHDMPVPVRIFTSSLAKELRAAEALAHYQRGRVLHLERLTSAEEQMVAFPNAPHDDEVDAVGSAVNHFLTPAPKKKTGVKVSSYV